MRIVYLHQYFNTPDMSGGTRSYEIARRLVRHGHDVEMITSWRRDDDRADWFTTVENGIRVHWLPVPYSNSMSYTRRIVAFLKFAWRSARKAASIESDVIFASSTPLTIALPAIFASRRREVPFVFEVRDMWPDVPIALGAIRNPILRRAARWLEKLAYGEAKRIVALAPGMSRDIVAKGVSDKKISVVPNGCDLSLYDAANGILDLRADNKWLGNRRLVLYAGAMGTANGVSFLVKLAARVAAIDNDIRFVLIGEGRERTMIRQIAETAGVMNQSLFMLETLAKRDLIPWLKAADIHVALMTGPEIYLKDAVNNKFFDALAAGRPIANNFYGWQTKIADEADIGLYLNPEDMDGSAIKLVETLHDTEWLAGVTERARELAQHRFNYDRLASKIEDVLADVIDVNPNGT